MSPEITIAKFATVKKGRQEVERKIDYYNLDIIISVGYCINSKEYMTQVFTID